MSRPETLKVRKNVGVYEWRRSTNVIIHRFSAKHLHQTRCSEFALR